MKRRSAVLLALLVLGSGAPGEEADEMLSSTLPARREKGAAALGKQGDIAAAKKLVALLKDRDWGVRMAALRALAPIRYAPGRLAVRNQALRGEIRAIRVLAAQLLKEHDAKDSAARIGKRMTKLKKESRLSSLRALGIIGNDVAVAALSKQMRAPDPLHRAQAARALIRLGAGEKALIHGLKDREDEVRLLAAVALAGIDSDNARKALLDRVERTNQPEEGYALRRIAHRAAGANRDAFAAALNARLEKTRAPGVFLRLAAEAGMAPCAVAARRYLRHRESLVAAYAFRVAGLGEERLAWEQVDRALRHKEGRVRRAAAEAYLAAKGDDRHDALRRLLLHKDPTVAMVAVRIAVEGRVKEVLKELVALAKGETAAKKGWQARVAACVGVGRVGWDKEFATLEQLAKAREWWLRAAAMEGLYHSFTKRAIPILLDAFDDRHPIVRMTTRRNLRYMTGKKYVKKKMFQGWWNKVKDKIELEHPERKLKELDKYGYATRKFLQEVLRGTDIVAVKGRWDKVEKILEDLEVRHMAVRAQQIKQFGISPKMVVLVNCEGSVDSETTRFLQWFVVAGGYMATTDWSLVNATTRTFPGFVKGYVRQSTGNDVVIVEPAAPKHPTLRGVFRDDVDLKWWLEIQAFPIAIEDPVRCTVLVDSLEMLVRYGSSAMMVEFPVGLGKVLHSTSHFYLQKEGFASESSALRRKIFASDHLGLSIPEIRALDTKGVFGNINDTTPISRSYSMFHLLVNYIDEKRQRDLKR